MMRNVFTYSKKDDDRTVFNLMVHLSSKTEFTHYKSYNVRMMLAELGGFGTSIIFIFGSLISPLMGTFFDSLLTTELNEYLKLDREDYKLQIEDLHFLVLNSKKLQKSKE